MNGASWCALIAFVMCFFMAALAQTPGKDTAAIASLHVDITLIDLPFNPKAADHWPSMAQSRTISVSLNELGCNGIAAAADRVHSPFGRICAITGMETALLMVSTYLPFGNTWVHEEYHRAVLAGRGINSYDGIYDNLDYDLNAVSVSHVNDDALVLLKASHPEDLVRCHAAGHEAQLDLAAALLQDGMMKNAPLIEYPALYALLANTGYMYFCTTKGADDEITGFNEKETTEGERDFTGWDYTAWTYDLHRPDESYTARGVHPSGNGINRYIRWTDLSPDEQKYLRLQTGLSLLNLIRPQLYGIGPWQTKTGSAYANITAGLQHCLTPFGYGIGLYMLCCKHGVGFTGSINAFRSGRLTLPGIDCGIVDIPFTAAKAEMAWSPRLALWIQPKDQRFDGRVLVPGILTGQKLAVRVNRVIGIYSELALKTTGWVSGIEDIGPAVDFRIGCLLGL